MKTMTCSYWVSYSFLLCGVDDLLVMLCLDFVFTDVAKPTARYTMSTTLCFQHIQLKSLECHSSRCDVIGHRPDFSVCHARKHM